MPAKTTSKSRSAAKKKTTPSIKTTVTKSKTNPQEKTVKIVADFPAHDAAADPTMWKGIAALVLGLISLFVSPLFILAIPVAVVGLVLGVWSLRTRGKSLGIAGIITAIIGLLISICMYLVFVQLSQTILKSIPSASPATNLPEVVLK